MSALQRADHLGALRRVAAEGAAQDEAHDRDGDRNRSSNDVGLRKVGIEQRAQNAKDNNDAENQTGNQSDATVRCDKLAPFQLAP